MKNLIHKIITILIHLILTQSILLSQSSLVQEDSLRNLSLNLIKNHYSKLGNIEVDELKEKALFGDYQLIVLNLYDNDYHFFNTVFLFQSGKIILIKGYKVSDRFFPYYHYKKFYEKKDHRRIKEFRQIQNEKYGMPFLLSKGLSIPKEIYQIGFRCGVAPTMTPITRKMVRLVKMKRKNRLIQWCKSSLPETRFCGVLGLEILKRKGVTINYKTELLIKKLKADPAVSYVCNGCLVRYSERNLVETLEYFSDSYEYYLNRKK